MFITRKDRRIVDNCRAKARKATKLCYSPGCNKNAIMSHIQQAEGPLRLIAKEGKVMQLMLNNSFEINPWRFQKAGIREGDILRFWGFCKECDSNLFKDVETTDVDYYDYRNLLLLSYRALCNELYKKEYNLKQFDKILKSTEISSACREQFEYKKLLTRVGIHHTHQEKKLIEENLINFNDKHYDFLIFKIGEINICGSIYFSLPEAFNLQRALADLTNCQRREGSYFVQLIPTKETTFFIIGRRKQMTHGYYNFSTLAIANEAYIFEVINEILLKFSESWCMSIEYYDQLQNKGIIQLILSTMKQYSRPEMKLEAMTFNMFNYK
ncbi:hypothetical protein [Mucilaginibacter terrae]|uniref:DUF3822 family protein n=1 Tax=Mucilaginibacter terrae TaxID=1955052 RepID=A0ABU3GRI3_9SPHI|nr:hypothetical protein [Mucilaginibacter terrae]MDT3402096.1 hypothetical protein [Mucilaginibacter terrae]